MHIGDYAAHTRNLSLLEDLAYRRLLDAYYLAEHPFNGSPADVAREIGMRDQVAEVEYILGKFFDRDGDVWSNKRADREIAKYHDKQTKASAAGKASAERRLNNCSTGVDKNSTDVGDTGNRRSTNQEPRTKNQEPIHPLAPKGEVPSGFATFWKAWPISDRKQAKGKCLEVWKKAHAERDAALILAHVERLKASENWRKQGGQFIPAPLVYLNERRWQGAEEAAPEAPIFAGAI